MNTVFVYINVLVSKGGKLETVDNLDLRTWDEVWEELAPQVEYLVDLEEREDEYNEIIAEYSDSDEEI